MKPRYVNAILGLCLGLTVSIHPWEKSPRVLAAAARLQIEAFKTMLESYKKDTGRYPSTEEGLAALWVAPPAAKNWQGPYIAKTFRLTHGAKRTSTP